MNLQPAFAFLTYLLKSKSRYSIHSPFLYDFIHKVLKHQDKSNDVQEIQALRKRQNNNRKTITIKDLGAVPGLKKRTISNISKCSGIPHKYGSILKNCVSYFNCKTVLELGTSLGYSGLYLNAGNRLETFVTIEGCPTIAELAKQNLSTLAISPTLLVGDFDEQLPTALSHFNHGIDLLYVDGNHTEEATIRYFNSCIPYINNDSVFIFDDIHWSKGMEQAWGKIKQHPKVTVSIDLYRMGMLFFRKESQKSHNIIKF